MIVSKLTCIYAPALALAIGLSACSEDTGAISRDAAPFDRVEDTAAISVLGTEPFWSLEIVPENGRYIATYATPDNIAGQTFPVSRFAGNNGLGFSGEIDGESMQLALTPGECSDGMSDRTFPYIATLLRAEVTLFGCGYTSDEPFSGDEAP